MSTQDALDTMPMHPTGPVEPSDFLIRAAEATRAAARSLERFLELAPQDPSAT